MSIYQNVDKSAVDIGGLYCNIFETPYFLLLLQFKSSRAFSLKFLMESDMNA